MPQSRGGAPVRKQNQPGPSQFDARGRADEPASCSNAVSKSKHAGTAGRVSLTVLIPAESLVELGFAKRPRLFVRELLATDALGRCDCGAANRKQHRNGYGNKNARGFEPRQVNLRGLSFGHHNQQ